MIKAKQIGDFFQDGMWTMDEQQLRAIPRGLLWTLRRIAITVKCFLDNNLPSFASALTYNCLLAFVPVLSIVFAIARGFGLGSEIEEHLRESMAIQPGSGVGEEVLEFVNHYIDNTHSGVFLGVGLLILLFTVVNLSSSIELAFNTIWHVRASRNVYRRIMDYTAVFILFPLLIMVTSGFSVFLMTVADHFSEYVAISGTMKLIIRYTPLILASLCFISLFKFMPNTHVKWSSVIIPGLLAGIAFQVLQYFYFNYQIKLSSYNAIYGSFAALPLFMLWLQFSWYICLSCGQLSYAVQFADDYLFARDSANLTRQDHDALCLMLMRKFCQRFWQGEEPYTMQMLAQETGIPLQLVRGLTDEMVEAKLLNEVYSVTGSESGYQPAIDVSRITPNYVMTRLDARGSGKVAYKWATNNNEWKKNSRQRAHLQLGDGDEPLVKFHNTMS